VLNAEGLKHIMKQLPLPSSPPSPPACFGCREMSEGEGTAKYLPPSQFVSMGAAVADTGSQK
jgi:hypothetical protein